MKEEQGASGELVEARMDKLVSGGLGLARDPEGPVLLVEGALAGELVRARVLARRRDYVRATVQEVLEPSPLRVEPACPYYGLCGGCDLMHLEYEAQLRAKAEWAAAALGRLPGLPPVVGHASPRPWRWRHRLRLHMQEGRAGFLQKASHRLVEVTECRVAADSLQETLAALSRAPAPRAAGLASGLELLAGESGPVWGVLGLGRASRLDPRQRRELEDWGRELGLEKLLLPGRGGRIEPQAGPVALEREGLSLLAYAGLFCQANLSANQELVQVVSQAAGPGQGERALDLYAGAGNLSLPLAQAGWRVLAVEGAPGALKVFNTQAKANHLEDRASMEAGPVERVLASLGERGDKCRLVVLDPPRAGAKGLMPLVAGLEPRVVIYVSCHPAALARDAGVLAGLGYGARELHLVDMFPQTSHLEVVLVLERAGG